MAEGIIDAYGAAGGSPTGLSAQLSAHWERDLRLLYEIGISAVAHGHGEAAIPIFDAIAVLEPGNAAAAIGYALDSIVRGEFDAAIALLTQSGASAGKSADEAKGLLVLALCMAGRRDDGRRLYLDLMAGPDGAGKQLARNLFAGDGVTPAARGLPRSTARRSAIAEHEPLPDAASI